MTMVFLSVCLGELRCSPWRGHAAAEPGEEAVVLCTGCVGWVSVGMCRQVLGFLGWQDAG